MRIVVLSTKSKHHTYFLNRLHQRFEIAGILYERRRLQKNYPTGPFFAEEEDAFEERFFESAYNGTSSELSEELAQRVVEVHDVNQAGVTEYLAVLKPDLAITYGVGLVRKPVFTSPRWGTINVHRGITQRYRGLNSDLWAMYEGHFDEIGVSIHYVDSGLDTGDILAQRKVSLEHGDQIYHLRYKTSVIAADLVTETLIHFEVAGERIAGTPHGEPGPYYSAMSLDEKWIALRRFQEYMNRLESD